MHITFPLELDYPQPMLRRLDALRAYAARHGRRRKHDLRLEWGSAAADPLLNRLRQTHGLTWLEMFQLPH